MITGQILYYVPSDKRNRHQAREVIVKSVGRQWATLLRNDGSNLEAGRCDKRTGWMDGRGYSSPGRCWPSQAAYEESEAANTAWSVLREHVNRLRPEHVCTADICQALELLGVPDVAPQPK